MLKYISSFDYLRAFFSILVVVWHASAVSFLVRVNSFIQHFIDIFYYNICLLAVPVFFSISLFIFYKKQQILQNCFPSNRLIKLISLYGIWTCIGIAINSITSKGEFLKQLIKPGKLLCIIVVGSRPELYFLFSLIFITLLAFVNSKYLLIRKNTFWIQLVLLFTSLLIIMLVDFTTLVTGKSIYSAYWNPICFVPYIFSSSILFLINEESRSNSTIPLYKKSIFTLFLQNKNLLIASLFFIFVLLSWQEWQTLNIPEKFSGYLLPPYARASLVFGSFLVCYYATLCKNKPTDLIRDLSQESLGIYLLHGYVLLLISYIVSFLSGLQIFQLLLSIVFNPIMKVVISITISVFLAKMLKQYKFGRVMLNASSK
jgi:Acyltransferase family